MKALIISDLASLRQRIRKEAESFPLIISIVDNLPDALEELNKGEYEIVLTDILCPGDPKILRMALKANPKTKVITVSKKMEICWLIKTLAQGGFDYVDLNSPFPMRNAVGRAIRSAIDHIKSEETSDE